MNMFAKLFSRITESSLMEEPIEVRYVFVMLLAISDPSGHVIGTDVAIARRLNISIDDFKRCVERLMQSDPNSNSKELDGRRVVPSEGERGYRIVNYLTYRKIRSEEERRDYMADYMKKYRQKKPDPTDPVNNSVNSVNNVNFCKPVLAHAEAEEEAEQKAEAANAAVVSKKPFTPPVKDIPKHLQTPRLMAKWGQWQNHRRAFKKPKCWATLFNEQIDWLTKFDEATAFECLSASIRNGWIGLFEPKPANPQHAISTPAPIPTKSLRDMTEHERQAEMVRRGVI